MNLFPFGTGGTSGPFYLFEVCGGTICSFDLKECVFTEELFFLDGISGLPCRWDCGGDGDLCPEEVTLSSTYFFASS